MLEVRHVWVNDWVQLELEPACSQSNWRVGTNECVCPTCLAIMIRISLPYIFRLAIQLEPLGNLPMEDTPYRDLWGIFFISEQALAEMHYSTLYAPSLRSSLPFASDLIGKIREQTNNDVHERTVEGYQLWAIKRAFEEYKTALLAELGSLNSYFVTQKGSHDSYALLMFGESLFPADLTTKVPEALFDAREAGKCLAFEVPTACAFHVFRATESVLRRYYTQVSQGRAPPKVRNIGVYLNALKQSGCGDAKALAALKQMTDLHRNPLVHPEAAITSDEALAIVGIARSAMTTMLAELAVSPPTTSAVGIANPD